MRYRLRTLLYTGPDGKNIVAPSKDQLENVIFCTRSSYWNRGSGDSGLTFCNPKSSRHVTANESALVFWLSERHGFFFTLFEPTKSGKVAYIPLAGGRSTPYVTHVIGGDRVLVPRASFVSRSFAWQIVLDFTETGKRSKSVPWVNRSTLGIPNTSAGDAIPRKKDVVR